MKFVVSRVLAACAQLLLLSLIFFVTFRILPGDIYSTDLADPTRSKASVEALRIASGSRQSWTRQYLSWAASALRGDGGISLAYGIPASRLIAPRARKTVEITAVGLLAAW